MIAKEERNQGIAGLVIDMQDILLDIYSPEVRDELIQNQINVLEVLRQRGYPIIVLKHRDAGDIDTRLRQVLEGYEKVKSLTKYRQDGFRNSQLELHLRTLNIDHLITMGVYTSLCVLDTTRSALHLGYKVSSSRDIILELQYYPQDLTWSSHDWFNENCQEFTESHRELLEIIS
jgi:nicotinamidase-related amidase